jgi:FKBP-type peptidyl-prolyl cis-trans isomerase FklB
MIYVHLLLILLKKRMKKNWLTLGLLILTTSIMTVQAQGKADKSKKGKSSNSKEQTMNIENKLDSVSYALGVNIAENLSSQGITELNTEALAKGMEDYFKKNNLVISRDEINNVINGYMQAKQAEQREAATREGREYLEKNGKRNGVVTLPSGLQYEVLISGNGPKPKPADKVTTHYHGMLIDGTVFDSSVERGQPATFGVTQVIQGWQEALQLMPQGSKWRLYIPYNLAYGERGAGGKIGPYATLIFDIELISIN